MNYVSIVCDLIQMACWCIVLGCFIRLFRERRELQRENRFMKQALEDIADAEVLIGFHPREDTEIYEYMEAITEMSRDIRRLMSKAHIALEAISASDEHPEEVER